MKKSPTWSFTKDEASKNKSGWSHLRGTIQKKLSTLDTLNRRRRLQVAHTPALIDLNHNDYLGLRSCDEIQEQVWQSFGEVYRQEVVAVDSWAVSILFSSSWKTPFPNGRALNLAFFTPRDMQLMNPFAEP